MNLHNTLTLSHFFSVVLMMGGIFTSEGSPEDGIYSLELYVVCDQAGYDKINKWDRRGTETYLLEVLQISAKTLGVLNVDLILVGLEIWSKQDKIKLAADMDEAIDHLADYRKTKLIARRWNDAVVLITGHDWGSGGGDARGLFRVGGVCTGDWAAGVIKYDAQSAARMAGALTHELGHGLGMLHDSSDCCSAGNGNCIMAPLLNNYHIQTPVFSSCSLENLKVFLASKRAECLDNKPTQVYPPDTCGNGVVEGEEECDCGAACLNNCCDCCNNCKLVSQAECASGVCCNTATCKFYGRRRVCRQRGDAKCDRVDYCSGDSTECQDRHKNEGSSCTDTQSQEGYCLGGNCRTRNVQCMETWTEDYLDADDACYTIAKSYPGEKGHCGVRSGGSYTKCTDDSENHYKCGLLQCAGDGNGLSRYMDPQRNYFVGGGHYCLSGKYGDWEERRWTPIMVEDGTKCDSNKVCYENDCLDAPQVFQQLELNKLANGNTTKSQSQVCGDGVVDQGEQCDCGPLQCECCDPVTCQLSGEGQNCIYNQCGKCDGNSTQCTSQAAEDYTLCDSGEGHCVKGSCHSLQRACKEVFGASAMVPLSRYITNTFGNSSQSNGGGFLLYDLNTFRWDQKKEFAPAPGDGQCGLLFCKAGSQAVVFDSKDTELNSKTFFLRDDPSIRIAYYSIETVRLGPREYYQKYLPLLVGHGTPCHTTSGKRGYCDTHNLRMDQREENWYWYSNCRPI